jgi:hypothetical protein
MMTWKIGDFDPNYHTAVCDAVPDLSRSLQMDWDGKKLSTSTITWIRYVKNWLQNAKVYSPGYDATHWGFDHAQVVDLDTALAHNQFVLLHCRCTSTNQVSSAIYRNMPILILSCGI